jgi:hypothetical protein
MANVSGAQRWSRTTAKLNGRCAKFNGEPLLRNLCCPALFAAQPCFLRTYVRHLICGTI